MLQHLVLRKAVTVCGSDETLGRILNVSTAQLRRWMDGKEAAPLRAFNEAMRLVNDAYRKAAADKEPASPPCEQPLDERR